MFLNLNSLFFNQLMNKEPHKRRFDVVAEIDKSKSNLKKIDFSVMAATFP